MGWNAEESTSWAAGGSSKFNDENANPNSFSQGFGENGFADNTFGGDGFGNKFGGDDFEPSAAAGQDGNNACRKQVPRCGNEGHFARECPEPRKAMACFNCGEEGHAKVDCPKPRVFKGTCRICNQEGHPAAECPERPPDVCKNCKMEGHKTMDCTENRKFDLNNVPDKLPEEAWAILKKASDSRDLEDFREGVRIYSKAVPHATFVDIEKRMREDNFCFYMIAMDKQVDDTISLINLQGKLNCKYVVGYYFNPKPQRAHLRERWPESPEENLERLADAGLPYDRQIPKCTICNEMGHTARGCKEERPALECVEVKCVNCSATGHRARDCTEPRRDPYACRNCGAPDHKASDCPNPRSAEGVECKRCGEVGHFAKDCPQASAPRTCRNCGSEDHIARDCDKPRDVSTVTCRNCDELGHFSRDCTKKKDWSKVQCNNCGEMGHTVRRCPQASTDDVNNGMDNGMDNDGTFAAAEEVVDVAGGSWNAGNEDAGW
ncbi:zinc knuckle transcription factor [Aspergillus terreus]|uniref:Zinc knuckle transcription factor n=1 Tax=Aspergillus terreus TaxID=33178 RepID=A0A5M3YWV9_ASPTE|nr:hypothetical protein ATETN484_0005041800 [Aspergillus terreus]GFF17083.1 zinc knuckle transcription factor [Aspergillus terreus]